MNESSFDIFNPSSTTLINEFTNIFLKILISGILGYYVSYVSHHPFFSNRKEPSYASAQFLLTFVSTVTILVIGGNIAYAIGLFGALSFIRFRTILREPRDTVLFFFSAGLGISIGAGQYLLSLIACVFFTSFLFIIKKFIYNNRNCFYVKLNISEIQFQNLLEKFLLNRKIKFEYIIYNSSKNTLSLRIYHSFNEILLAFQDLKIEFPTEVKGYSINEEIE